MPFTKADLRLKIRECDEHYEYFTEHANWYKNKKKEYEKWLKEFKERLGE